MIGFLIGNAGGTPTGEKLGYVIGVYFDRSPGWSELLSAHEMSLEAQPLYCNRTSSGAYKLKDSVVRSKSAAEVSHFAILPIECIISPVEIFPNFRSAEEFNVPDPFDLLQRFSRQFFAPTQRQRTDLEVNTKACYGVSYFVSPESS